MARVCLIFSYPFQCGYFVNHLICRSQSASFWISPKGNFFVCIWCFKGGGIIRSYLGHNLGNIHLIIFKISHIKPTEVTMYCNRAYYTPFVSPCSIHHLSFSTLLGASRADLCGLHCMALLLCFGWILLKKKKSQRQKGKRWQGQAPLLPYLSGTESHSDGNSPQWF